MLEVLIGLGGLAVVVTGAALAQQGALDPGLLPLMTILAMAAFLPVSEIAQIGRQLADTLGATRRVYALANEPIPVRDGKGVAPRKGAAALALEKVNFTYPGQSRRALSDVSFEIPAGKTVALVGTSGAGKTTTAQLLMRFWDPDSGRITLNGADLRDYKLDALRRLVALVAQDTYLFNDSLRANILIARPEASEAELQAAIEHASLAELVAALPEGLDSAGRRTRHQPVGRPAPARRHRPRLPEGRAHPGARRGDLASRRGERAGGAPRARRAAGRPHHGRHRPPAVDGARRRPDRGAGRGPRRRDRHARLAAGAGRPLRPAGFAPARVGLCSGRFLSHPTAEPAMFSHVTVGSNDVAKAKAFYDGLLKPLGLVRHADYPNGVGYGRAGGRPQLWIVSPLDKKAASVGNGITIGLEAPDRPAVDAAYKAGMAARRQGRGCARPAHALSSQLLWRLSQGSRRQQDLHRLP